MRNKPYTPGELFDAICKRIELPAILDYHLPARGGCEILDCEFMIHNSLNYGGSEGIYLDIWLSSPKYGSRVSMGTFKTLETSHEAMRTMGQLLADFIVGYGKLWNEEPDDFEWSGYKLTPLREDGTDGISFYVYSLKALKNRIELLLDSYCSVIVRDNLSRKTHEYTKANAEVLLREAT